MLHVLYGINCCGSSMLLYLNVSRLCESLDNQLYNHRLNHGNGIIVTIIMAHLDEYEQYLNMVLERFIRNCCLHAPSKMNIDIIVMHYHSSHDDVR